MPFGISFGKKKKIESETSVLTYEKEKGSCYTCDAIPEGKEIVPGEDCPSGWLMLENKGSCVGYHPKVKKEETK